MSAYLKKIAVIKQVKGGFSADGGSVSGIVKAETYAGFLKVEVSLINFAPLTEGRYVLGITDGLNTVTFEGLSYEGEGDFNLSSGFAFLVCFCNNTVAPVASASCGEMACALPDLKGELTKEESLRAPGTNADKQGAQRSGASKQAASRAVKETGAELGAGADAERGFDGAPYDDEAISEENYYEHTFQGSAAVCQAEAQEADWYAGAEDAQDFSAIQGEEEVGIARNGSSSANQSRAGKGRKKTADELTAADGEGPQRGGRGVKGGLAGGDFYSRMEADIRKIFATYPKESELERAVEGGRFAKIFYGDNKYYVFGVLTVEGKPRYICYGVPARDPENPPPSFKNSSYIPTPSGGYWMTYQDASTGVSIRLMQS